MEKFSNNFFELTYFDYEDQGSWMYSHSEKKTQEEFEADVKSLLVKYGQEFMCSEVSWIGGDDWVRFISDKMSDLGYTMITPTRCNIPTTSIIQREDDANDWTEWVGEELVNMALTKNADVKRQMYDDLEQYISNKP